MHLNNGIERLKYVSKLKNKECIIEVAYAMGSCKVLVDLHYGTIKGSNLKKDLD